MYDALASSFQRENVIQATTMTYSVNQDGESTYINTGMGAFIKIIPESCTSGLVAGSCLSEEHA